MAANCPRGDHGGPLIHQLLDGAPLLARELETGTSRYAWTQGFGRMRWTLAKLAGLAIVVTGAVGAMSVLSSWYYQPYFSGGSQGQSLYQGVTDHASVFAPGLFDVRGVSFAAWALAAFAIGAFAGRLIGRVVPAIVATLAAYTSLALATGEWLRQHHLTPFVTSSLNLPGSAWVIGERWTTKGGPAGQPVGDRPGTPGDAVRREGGVPQSLSAWQYLVRNGYTQLTTYQPVGRFWTFQWIEGGWLLALSLLLFGATLWMVHHRAT